jgi:hypothetical protein
MNARDAFLLALSSTQSMMPMYLDGLSDVDLLVRPVPGANHTAWQLGHLISSEKFLLHRHLPVSYPEFPAGFEELHSGKKAGVDQDPGFLTKEKYLGLFNQVREITKSAVARLNDADFDKPAPGPLEKMAPTLGALLQLAANHTLMHGGQVTVLRRKLGKPVKF